MSIAYDLFAPQIQVKIHESKMTPTQQVFTIAIYLTSIMAEVFVINEGSKIKGQTVTPTQVKQSLTVSSM